MAWTTFKAGCFPKIYTKEHSRLFGFCRRSFLFFFFFAGLIALFLEHLSGAYCF